MCIRDRLYTVPQTYIEDVTVVTTIEPQAQVKVKVKLNAAVDGKGSVQLKGGKAVLKADLTFSDGVAEATPVSYTHLTLPTSDLV